MFKHIKSQIFEFLAVPLILGILTTVANGLIPDARIRSYVIGILLVGILAALLLPQLSRILKIYFAVASLHRFIQRTSILHQFIHQSRDLCIRLLPVVPAYSAPDSVGSNCFPHPALLSHKASITTILENAVRLFELSTPPGTKIWACIRDRRADDCYHTFQRAGHYTPQRSDNTRGMHKKKSKAIQRLRDSYESGRCVIITGSAKGPQMWEPQDNDKYKEDRCVMMGAVMTKSHGEAENDWKNTKLAWILCINADTEDVFTEHHIPLMQSCVDVFSIIANVASRA